MPAQQPNFALGNMSVTRPPNKFENFHNAATGVGSLFTGLGSLQSKELEAMKRQQLADSANVFANLIIQKNGADPSLVGPLSKLIANSPSSIGSLDTLFSNTKRTGGIAGGFQDAVNEEQGQPNAPPVVEQSTAPQPTSVIPNMNTGGIFKSLGGLFHGMSGNQQPAPAPGGSPNYPPDLVNESIKQPTNSPPVVTGPSPAIPPSPSQGSSAGGLFASMGGQSQQQAPQQPVQQTASQTSSGNNFPYDPNTMELGTETPPGAASSSGSPLMSMFGGLNKPSQQFTQQPLTHTVNQYLSNPDRRAEALGDIATKQGYGAVIQARNQEVEQTLKLAGLDSPTLSKPEMFKVYALKGFKPYYQKLGLLAENPKIPEDKRILAAQTHAALGRALVRQGLDVDEAIERAKEALSYINPELIPGEASQTQMGSNPFESIYKNNIEPFFQGWGGMTAPTVNRKSTEPKKSFYDVVNE